MTPLWHQYVPCEPSWDFSPDSIIFSTTMDIPSSFYHHYINSMFQIQYPRQQQQKSNDLLMTSTAPHSWPPLELQTNSIILDSYRPHTWTFNHSIITVPSSLTSVVSFYMIVDSHVIPPPLPLVLLKICVFKPWSDALIYSILYHTFAHLWVEVIISYIW